MELRSGERCQLGFQQDGPLDITRPGRITVARTPEQDTLLKALDPGTMVILSKSVSSVMCRPLVACLRGAVCLILVYSIFVVNLGYRCCSTMGWFDCELSDGQAETMWHAL